MTQIKIIDLFGGIGGFRYGIERAIDTKYAHLGEEPKQKERRQGRKRIIDEQGKVLCSGNKPSLRCVLYADIDKYATAVYNYNFKEDWKPTDITKLKSEDIPDHDILCGGFPCQAFSIAGKRRGFEDTRGTLFFEIARILRDKRPKMVFLENVKGLLSHENGRTFATILDTLRQLGYVGQYQVLNSKHFGVPQNRERVFIIGTRGKSPRQVFPLGQDGEAPESPVCEVHPILDANYYKGASNQRRMLEVPEIAGTLTGGGHSGGLHSDMTAIPVIIREQFDISGKGYNSEQDRVYHTEGILGCLPAARTESKVNIFQGTRIRRLTPTECEALQSFPRDWTKYGLIDSKKTKISDTQRYKMIGNSVTTNVIQAIARELL